MCKPPIPITDPRFVYTPSHATDVRVRFNRERARLAKQAAQRASHLTIFDQRTKGQA